MSAYRAAPRIQLTLMPQLAEAVDGEDDWTGLANPVSRRKRQNRLNVRAYRRRKALELQAHRASVSTSGTSVAKIEPDIPCWVEDQQMVLTFPASVANALSSIGTPLIPSQPTAPKPAGLGGPPSVRVIFPLSPDHLITLLQFNVLRSCLTNRHLLSCLTNRHLLFCLNNVPNECSSAVVNVLPYPSVPQALPLSLHPTVLQRTVPHEEWIDIIPHPGWRDNLILASGKFDEDELWADTLGGLFEGLPASEVEHRGVVAWSPPWHVSGWEVSEGFWRKWGWSFKGCGDVLEATNRWRRERGDEPLVFDV